MSVPNVRVDNYVEDKSKSRLDFLSKTYIVSGWLIGINRLPIIYKTKGICKIFTLGYPLIVNCTLLASVLTNHLQNLKDIVTTANLIQYFVCSIVGFFSQGQLIFIYNNLYKFDEEIRSKWYLSNSSKHNFLHISCMLISFLLFNILCRKIEGMIHLLPELYPILLNHMIEFYYYAHLLSLLELRLRTIRILLLSSFPITGKELNAFSEKQFINDEDKNVINLRNNNSNVEMKKLMKMYTQIIETYDYLNDAVKWQLLTMLTTSFLTILCMSYHAALKIISGNYTWKSTFFDVSVTMFEITPVIVPCLYSEKIHTEVQLLRTSLQTRISNDVFDKPSRSIASCFSTMTQVRRLSFSVFHMIDINIPLPFKFFGLLTTYLIILLQFQKVIHLES
nr:gustatory receptor 15 [Papilio glaucus]